jgi:aminomethyltransferase
MKQTPLQNIHMGAKMARFAGYNMPISYTGINDEHAAVRNNAGVFDVSHMGEVYAGAGAAGSDSAHYYKRCYKLTAGKAQYSCLPNNNEGGIVDDACSCIALRKMKPMLLSMVI